MNSKKESIIKEIQKLASSQGFEWINAYSKPKDSLIFKHILSEAIVTTNWSNLKQRGRIALRNCNNYHQIRLEEVCNKYDLIAMTPYVNYLTPIKYSCKKCNTEYKRIMVDIYKCGNCNKFYKGNKGINAVTVLRDPYVSYRLYFVYIPKYNAYKIGLYKGKYVKSRFNTNVNVLKVMELPLYKAYYLEQYLISKFKHCKYEGEKFGGYTEAFNDTIDKENVMNIMGAPLDGVEPRELLENLEVDNQQPSIIEI